MKNVYKFFIALHAMLLSTVFAIAQQTGEPEMADVLRSNGKIYVVVAVLLIIFIGLIIFLISIDRKVSRLEKKEQNNP